MATAGRILPSRNSRKAPPPVDRSITQYVSKWIVEQNLDVKDIVQKIYDRTNKQYGTSEKPSQ